MSATEAGIDAANRVEPRFPDAELAGEVLTPEAIAFLAALHREFEPRRRQLLERRAEVQREIESGVMPDFLAETAEIRAANWSIESIPGNLQDRRVEITGPTERKMMINALNSGARVFMADFEDALSPTARNVLQGQINVRDAVRGSIAFVSPEGKSYALDEQVATLMVRPRGWHLTEKHVSIEGEPMSASLFDFGLFIFHNARALLDRGTGPYLYLPKLESYLEARLWNDVFLRAQDSLEIPRGSIKATVLIETILAAFQMDEILFELREHSAGLNCGRWDYIFSVIKKFRADPGFTLPDRGQVTMATHMMHSYSLLAIKTCHRRGAHAIGGMAAYIPVRGDAEANERAFAAVTVDKRREAGDGHDGTWVAHPGMVALATEVFDVLMPEANQIAQLRDDVEVTASDLLGVPSGDITMSGLRQNVRVGLMYLASWLGGQGAAGIDNLMEDVATAEISRAQIWQWLHHGATMSDGVVVDLALVESVLQEELDALIAAGEPNDRARFDRAGELFHKVATNDEWVDFLTLAAYPYLP